MYLRILVFVSILGLHCISVRAETAMSWLSPEWRRIERDERVLLNELVRLPDVSEQHLTGRLGYHSRYSEKQDSVEWVELRLPQAHTMDAVVLIATTLDSDSATRSGYGFPLRFRVEIFNDDDASERTIIADYTSVDFPNPGSLPVVIPAHGLLASKVRITATRLFQADKRHLFALGEVMLLGGERNLAAQIEAVGPESVLASSSQGTRPAWGRINLVDGQTVLGPPLGVKSSPTLGFRSKLVSERRTRTDQEVSVDLGIAEPIDEVRLFPAHPPEFEHSPGYGFPVQYQIELRDTVDATPLILTPPSSGNYSGPPGDNAVTLVANGQIARHIRLKVLEPHVSNGSTVLALAEMQVWSSGNNVALGKPVSAIDSTETGGWSSEALVDGFASSANIVDWSGWLNGLSQRREVLQQIASIESRKEQLVQQWQRYGLGSLGAIVALSIAGGIASSVRQRRQRLREMESLRQRISSDLHDEIGSSLGSIALIAQDILASDNPGPQTRNDLTEIRHIADETVSAMRDITRLIQSDRYGSDDLPTLLRDNASRLLRSIPHTLTFETTAPAQKLSVDRQRDLILMFKEALHNITRHANASTVDIRLAQSKTQLSVTLHDTGCGFDSSASSEGTGLTNIQRRAAKHGGYVQIESVPTQGTTLTISLPIHD